MANLHSTMCNGRGSVTSSTSNDYAETMVETYQVRIITTLKKDGSYTVIIADRETGGEIDRHTGQYPHPDYLAQLRKEEEQAKIEQAYRNRLLRQ